MKKWLATVAWLSLAVTQMGAVNWSEDVEDALRTANREGRMVLLDFYAPWCYSCYFMEERVLHTEGAERRLQAMMPVRVDVDTPAGAHQEQLRNVSVLPTYVLLDRRGQEIDRLVGEKPAEEFLKWLDTAGHQRGAPTTAAQIVASLERDVKRGSHAAGLKWFGSLTDAQQRAVRATPEGEAVLTRLVFMNQMDAPEEQCRQAGLDALMHAAPCEQSYIAYDMQKCADDQAFGDSAAWAGEIVTTIQPLAERLLDEMPAPSCADVRTPVLLAAQAQRALDHPEAAAALLHTAIEVTRSNLGERLVGNRNLADNLRVYLKDAGATDELLALYPRLIAAYPDDYVYADRFGRELAELGRHQEAVAQFERASASAYGVNRLRLAGRYAKSLQALGRNAEARKVLAGALQANGRWFPNEAAELQQQLSQMPR